MPAIMSTSLKDIAKAYGLTLVYPHAQDSVAFALCEVPSDTLVIGSPFTIADELNRAILALPHVVLRDRRIAELEARLRAGKRPSRARLGVGRWVSARGQSR